MDLFHVPDFERDDIKPSGDHSFFFRDIDSYTPDFDLASSDIQAFPSGGDYPITLAGSGYDKFNHQDEDFTNSTDDFHNHSSPDYTDKMDYSSVSVNSMEGYVDMSYKPTFTIGK